VHAPASFGRAFSISLITALVGAGVYGCFGKSSGRPREIGGRLGRPSGSPLGWLKMVVEAERVRFQWIFRVGVLWRQQVPLWQVMAPYLDFRQFRVYLTGIMKCH
jgi:hypothetical protein